MELKILEVLHMFEYVAEQAANDGGREISKVDAVCWSMKPSIATY